MRQGDDRIEVGAGDGMTDGECRAACGLPSAEEQLRTVALLDVAVFRRLQSQRTSKQTRHTRS